MRPGSRLHRLHEPDAPVQFTWEGTALTASPGDTVAAALLAAGVDIFRETPARGTPRAPYCMMGTCFDCLVEIDGTPARQACMTEVRDGMAVRRQHGAAEIGHE